MSTSTVIDVLDNCQAVTDCMREAMYRLEGDQDTDAVLQALNEIEDAANELATARSHAVQVLRGRGYTWSMVAELYSVTKQAAQQRFGFIDR